MKAFLARGVAVGGVPAVELLPGPAEQPLDDLDIEPGDGGEVLGGATGRQGPPHLIEGRSRHYIAFAQAVLATSKGGRTVTFSVP